MLSSLNNEDRLVGLSMLLTLGGISLGSAFEEPNFLGYTTLLVITILIIGSALTKSGRLAWLLIFGFVAGFLELWADWLHVTHLGSLVYTDYFGFRVLTSPSYMPVGWWLTVVQFGYIALRLSEHWPPWIAVALVTVLGMSLPPW